MREKNGVISEMIARFYLLLSGIFTTATKVFTQCATWCVIAARYFSNKAKGQLTQEESSRIPQ